MKWTNLTTWLESDGRVCGCVEQVERPDPWDVDGAVTKWSATWIGREGQRVGRDFYEREDAIALVERLERRDAQQRSERRAA